MLAFLQVKKRLNGFCNCETSQQCWKLQIDISPFQFNWNVATIKTSSLTPLLHLIHRMEERFFEHPSTCSKMRHLFMQLTYSERLAWFSWGYCAPPLLHSQTGVPFESRLAVWVPLEKNGLSCISLLYVIWLNQHGWNDFMSIHEFCFISQTEKFSQCKRLANASALCDSQIGGINMTWLMLTQTEVPLGVEEVFDCEWNRAWLVQRSQWKPCRFSFTAKTDQRAAGGRFLIHRNNVSSGARSSCQRGKRSSMCGEGSCLLEKAADIQKMKNTVYIPRAMKK